MTPETTCLIENSKNEEKINKIENSTTNNYCINCQKHLNNNLKQQNNNCFIKNIFCLILIIFFIILILIIFILPIIERKNKNYFLTNINGNCLCLEKNTKLNDGKFKNREKRQSFFEMPFEYKTIINDEEVKSNKLDNVEEQRYHASNNLESLNYPKTDRLSPLFVPLYAQIPADKLREICLDKFYKEFEKEFEYFNSKRKDIINQKQITINELNEDNRTLKTNISEQHNNTLKRNRKKMRKRKSNSSSIIKWISPASLINTRFDLKINSAVRHGNRWFMSEYGNSYTLLQFDNYTETNFDSNMDVHFTKKQKDFYYNFLPSSISFPSYIHTISEPFYGTDFTVGGVSGNEILFYEMASNYNEEGVMIQSFNLNNGQKMKKLIYAENIPLYGNISPNQKNRESSSIDFEYDQLPSPHTSQNSSQNTSSILWILYRPFSSSSTLSVLKLSPQTLEDLEHWEFKEINPAEMINAFVARGVLYKLIAEEGSTNKKIQLNIVPIFDFKLNKYLIHSNPLKFKNGGCWEINKNSDISNVQYDSLSDSISVTQNGKIYLIKFYKN